MRTCTVMFADDEEVSRQRFPTLVDWEKEGLVLLGVFRDGEAVWEAMDRQMPDILVTDINMPHMDGISVLEKLRARKARTRVVFLTGYEYFEYARKAIELRAFDFLLKPVTSEMMVECLRRAAFDIEREEAAQIAAELGQELTQSEFFERLLKGKIDPEQVEEEAERLGIAAHNRNFLLMAVNADPPEGETEAEVDFAAQAKRLWDTVRAVCAEENRAGRDLTVYRARGRGTRYACVFSAPREAPFTDGDAKELGERVRSGAQDGSARLTVAAGKNRTLLSEMPESYVNVKEALKNRHILGVGRVLLHVDGGRSQEEVEQIVLPTETFLKHIRQGEVEEVEHDIRELYARFRHQNYLSLSSARMVTTELAITAFKGELSVQGESVSYLFHLNHIQQLMTLDEMEEDIRKLACRIAEQRRRNGNSKRSTAEKALEYLRTHYMEEDLSLNEVAGHLAISVPYLAVLFKQETGRNFGAHLLEIRMDRAKELLRTTDKTISEISEAVGYGSPQYFSVCFKKYTGVTPGSYREM